MTFYLLTEIACCVLLAAALVGFTGGSVLAWKAAARLAGGMRQAARPALESISADLERRLAGCGAATAVAPAGRKPQSVRPSAPARDGVTLEVPAS